MITELGKRCQEMARIQDFASFRVSGTLGADFVFASFKKESSYAAMLTQLTFVLTFD